MKIKSLLSVLILATSWANADLITGLTIESATIGLNDQMGPEKAINGFGLEGDVPSLTASHRAGFNTNWWTGWDGNVTEWQITIDLEGNYKLDTVHIWNYRENNFTGRGLSNVEIYVSPDENEANLVKLTTDGSGIHDSAGGFLFPEASNDSEYLGFDLDLSGVTNQELLSNARLFRIDGGSANHNGGSDHGGLGEIQFDGSPAVENSGPLQLIVTPNGANFDFSWESKADKVYDLVSSTDLSIPVAEWPVYDGRQGILATEPMNTLSDLTSIGPKRFFALVEKNGN